ncbi:MAG: immunity 53 family protein [Chthonomonadaceae bacterium]|nr:immunity 53 family protein [Chthonomonadaceae bacterium]
MANELEKLQSWYAAQCEEMDDSGVVPWQHRYGIGISTSDNPAWNVGIELTGTDMEGATMSTIKIYNTAEDWYQCNIQKDMFHGVGDPSKLVTILEVFFQLVSERQGAESNSSLTNES